MPARPATGRRRVLATACLLALAIPGTVPAAVVYVYQDARGSSLITDHPRNVPGYTLVRRYGIGEERPAPSLRARRSDYDDLIMQAARMAGVDAALVKAVVHAESAFRADARSHKGAVGLMQLMAATASERGVADRSDPWQNLLGGSRYLRELLTRYQDTALALAAYNAGPMAVRRYDGIPPYPETEDYVRRVLDLHALYRQQEQRAGGEQVGGNGGHQVVEHDADAARHARIQPANGPGLDDVEGAKGDEAEHHGDPRYRQ